MIHPAPPTQPTYVVLSADALDRIKNPSDPDGGTKRGFQIMRDVWAEIFAALVTPFPVSVRPSDYAIPDAQWEEICTWILALPLGDMAKVQLAMEWVNRSPSGRPHTDPVPSLTTNQETA